MSFPDPSEGLTESHMNDPQPGDRFTEHLCFWVHVVGREGDKVRTREYVGGDLNYQHVAHNYESVEDFRLQYAYKNIPGYTISYVGNYPDFIEEE